MKLLINLLNLPTRILFKKFTGKRKMWRTWLHLPGGKTEKLLVFILIVTKMRS